jgi:hypothetical protein
MPFLKTEKHMTAVIFAILKLVCRIETVVLTRHTLKVAGSNLRHYTDYPHSGFSFLHTNARYCLNLGGFRCPTDHPAFFIR